MVFNMRIDSGFIFESCPQWRTQEFCWGGFNKFSWGQRTERTGIWGQ